jgi:hypothetical protein
MLTNGLPVRVTLRYTLDLNRKNIINCEVIDVDIASVESNHVLFHSVERCMEDRPSNPPYIECPFNGERSLIQTVVMPTQDVDVLKLGNVVQKLLNNVSREERLPIVDNDKKNIFFLLKKWTGLLLIILTAPMT